MQKINFNLYILLATLLKSLDVSAGLINGGFEYPSVNGSFDRRANGTVPGWRTTASDSPMEFWTSGLFRRSFLQG
jgi:hypothetical protein